MGLSSDASASYAAEVVKADFQEAGDDDVLRQFAGDLGDKSNAGDMRTKMTALMATAKAKPMEEPENS